MKFRNKKITPEGKYFLFFLCNTKYGFQIEISAELKTKLR